MRILRWSSAFILLLAASAWCQDAATDQKALQGKWSLTSGEIAGQPFPEAQLKSISLVITGDKYAVKVGDKTDLGTVKLDPAKKPRAMDILGTEGPNKGKTLLAIYEINGETLRLCYDL